MGFPAHAPPNLRLSGVWVHVNNNFIGFSSRPSFPLPMQPLDELKQALNRPFLVSIWGEVGGSVGFQNGFAYAKAP